MGLQRYRIKIIKDVLIHISHLYLKKSIRKYHVQNLGLTNWVWARFLFCPRIFGLFHKIILYDYTTVLHQPLASRHSNLNWDIKSQNIKTSMKHKIGAIRDSEVKHLFLNAKPRRVEFGGSKRPFFLNLDLVYFIHCTL